MKKRGRDMSKLRVVMTAILEGLGLPEALRDHALKGGWRGRRECHVEPDWLVIYLLRGEDEAVFERTGTHADLFE